MVDQPRARRYAVISGKGGVGKSVITANLAAAFAAAGRRTLVLDADLGLANLDVLLGLNPSGTIQDVLSGRLAIEEALVHTRSGFDLLPAGSATLEASYFTPSLAADLTAVLENIESRYDVVLFDVGAGIGEVVLFFANLADEVVVIVTPEPTSIMDAYATVKVLALRHGCKDVRLIVNQVDPDAPEQAGTLVAGHLQRVVTRYLDAECGFPVRLHFTGSIPSDPAVSHAIRQRQLLCEMAPGNPVSRSIPRLAERLQASL